MSRAHWDSKVPWGWPLLSLFPRPRCKTGERESYPYSQAGKLRTHESSLEGCGPHKPNADHAKHEASVSRRFVFSGDSRGPGNRQAIRSHSTRHRAAW